MTSASLRMKKQNVQQITEVYCNHAVQEFVEPTIVRLRAMSSKAIIIKHATRGWSENSFAGKVRNTTSRKMLQIRHLEFLPWQKFVPLCTCVWNARPSLYTNASHTTSLMYSTHTREPFKTTYTRHIPTYPWHTYQQNYLLCLFVPLGLHCQTLDEGWFSSRRRSSNVPSCGLRNTLASVAPEHVPVTYFVTF